MNMRVFALAGVIGVSSLVSTAASAADVPPVHPLTLAALAAPMPPADPPGFNEWRENLKVAKARRRHGFYFIVGGAAGSTLLSVINPENGTKWVLLGVGASGYGLFLSLSAQERLSDLQEEGAIRGFYKVRVADGLSITPVPGGIGAKVALSF